LFVPVQIRESKCELAVNRDYSRKCKYSNIGKGFDLQRFGGCFFPIRHGFHLHEGARWRVRVYLAFAKGKCKRDEVEENSARVFKR
jgi:hypothetical protein